MRIAIAQSNLTVGDIAGNEARILGAYRRGIEAGVELVVCPELAVTGYPPRDLLLRPAFVRENLAAVQRLAAATGPVGLLVGFVSEHPERPGRGLRNSAALLRNGSVVAIRHKTLLPTYDVFDEDRYFEPATDNLPIDFDGRKLGVTICEDVWNDADFWPERRYRPDPASVLVAAGAEILVNLSASPWHLDKDRTRHGMLANLARKTRRPVVYCNLVGGNDELVFDGQSVAFDATGALAVQGAAFAEDFLVVDTDAPGAAVPRVHGREELLFGALVLGTRDYLHKCGFKSAVLGLSGGIDSAVVACIAVEALGLGNVRGLALPSQYSSPGSLDDARALSANLGIAHDVVPIQPPFEAVKEQLRGVFAGLPEDVAEENIQARLRGVILMAMSNKFGSLLLTTGNKSELAVGYCTLYGDMCGGLAVISDVPKTQVYRLAEWINADSAARFGRAWIPRASIDKPPSAELRPNQTDQDSLPPYEVLDSILEQYVVGQRSPSEIIAGGHAEADVRRVVRLIDLAEYKRRQAAPGLKVTTKAFGVGRRVPVAQRWREA
ncbi:MAG: NAD+ synthase [Verrucomicrobia bacterium]|nr:MAG: NAD+ synthase [Verrucomicrobiota bacterium]